jgi:putative ABC transport system permease protein
MLANAFLLAVRAIRRNVLRSILTVLGIVIGVAAVIAMVIIGDGTTAYVTNSISKLGSNMLTVRPGQDRHGPRSGSETAPPFDQDDVEAIEREIYGVRAASPLGSKNVKAVYGNANYSTTVYGSDDGFFEIRDWTLEQGRTFEKSELTGGKAVCVLGETVRKELFGKQEALGQTIRLESFACEVVGLLKSKGASAFGMDQDDLIVVPIRMFQRRISGNRDIPTILLSAEEGISTSQVKQNVTELMRERRRIRSGNDDDFHVRDMKDIIETLSTTTEMLTYLLGAVAAISLLVGGIGIMNIMLVSVTERTREIGIRLAIGALEREVLLQFLVEAVVLSSLGGLIGIGVGLGAAYAGTLFFGLPFVINEMIVVIAFSFSTIVGVIFGYFPARKAAHLDPIEALRHE